MLKTRTAATMFTVSVPPLTFYTPDWDQVFMEGHRDLTLDNLLLYLTVIRAIRKGRLKRGVWSVIIRRRGIFWVKASIMPVAF